MYTTLTFMKQTKCKDSNTAYGKSLDEENVPLVGKLIKKLAKICRNPNAKQLYSKVVLEGSFCLKNRSVTEDGSPGQKAEAKDNTTES